MNIRIEIQVEDRNCPPFTHEQLDALRAAVNAPKAIIVENRKPVGGRALVHVVQTIEDVIGLYGEGKTEIGSPLMYDEN